MKIRAMTVGNIRWTTIVASNITIAAASLKIAAGSWTIASASLVGSVGNWKVKNGEWKMGMGVDIGADVGILPYAVSISIPSDFAPNPDGSAFSINHTSN